MLKFFFLTSLSKTCLVGLALGLSLFAAAQAQAAEKSVRETVASAIVAQPAEAQRELILSLKLKPSAEAVEWFGKWKEGAIFLLDDAAGVKTPVILTGSAGADDSFATRRVSDGMPLLGEDGAAIRVNPKEVEFAETDSGIRRAMKEVSDVVALADPDLTTRLRAIRDAAVGQKIEKLPALQLLKTTEKNADALRALEESIAIIQLRSPSTAERVVAFKKLGDLESLAALGTIRTILAETEAAKDIPTALAAKKAIAAIEGHVSRINAVGTAFRGISLASVLLVVAIGLAITFGLMGIINMAHGELIAVGAYTTYIIQNVFASGLNLSPFGMSISIPGMQLSADGMDLYFVVALPASFLAAALVGLALEHTVIQFLYRRPLESLLATWGISLVLQQLFRLIFGANNVQVSSPSWLSGNWTVNDVVFGWNRVFVIGFAVLIIVVTWLVLNKTSLGLLIRAVMQNRNMAACMGVRTERVNMMTFAFGCGLAGLAGAFLSQIGNVGPSLGQNYIVDAFMTVVVGGVGNILGTVISAFGIGMADQSLQQYLGNPVIGKILVLGAIILFLQWRPAGIFVTRSRSLD
jgi:urea transport system permease protein